MNDYSGKLLKLLSAYSENNNVSHSTAYNHIQSFVSGQKTVKITKPLQGNEENILKQNKQLEKQNKQLKNQIEKQNVELRKYRTKVKTLEEQTDRYKRKKARENNPFFKKFQIISILITIVAVVIAVILLYYYGVNVK